MHRYRRVRPQMTQAPYTTGLAQKCRTLCHLWAPVSGSLTVPASSSGKARHGPSQRIQPKHQATQWHARLGSLCPPQPLQCLSRSSASGGGFSRAKERSFGFSNAGRGSGIISKQKRNQADNQDLNSCTLDA